MDTSLIEISSALLTPVIGIATVIIMAITGYIAYQQYLTNRIKLKHDLFERYKEVYTSIMYLFSIILQEGKLPSHHFYTFIKDTYLSYFLFDKDTYDYIELVRTEAQKLMSLTRTMNSAQQLSKDDLNRILQENEETLQWFDNQFEVARKKFDKYLRLSE